MSDDIWHSACVMSDIWYEDLCHSDTCRTHGKPSVKFMQRGVRYKWEVVRVSEIRERKGEKKKRKGKEKRKERKGERGKSTSFFLRSLAFQ